MKTWIAILLFGLAAELLAQQPAPEEGRSRFCAVDIYVDAGSTPLAAYQLAFAATNGVARIVGIEGGEHPAFRQPRFMTQSAPARARHYRQLQYGTCRRPAYRQDSRRHHPLPGY